MNILVRDLVLYDVFSVFLAMCFLSFHEDGPPLRVEKSKFRLQLQFWWIVNTVSFGVNLCIIQSTYWY